MSIADQGLPDRPQNHNPEMARLNLRKHAVLRPTRLELHPSPARKSELIFACARRGGDDGTLRTISIAYYSTHS
jgi:hypothetical protein